MENTKVRSKLSDRELRRLMNQRMVSVKMSEAEVLLLHGVSVFKDGRHWLWKIVKRRIRPVAFRILKKRKEYN